MYKEMITKRVVAIVFSKEGGRLYRFPVLKE